MHTDCAGKKEREKKIGTNKLTIEKNLKCLRNISFDIETIIKKTEQLRVNFKNFCAEQLFFILGTIKS